MAKMLLGNVLLLLLFISGCSTQTQQTNLNVTASLGIQVKEKENMVEKLPIRLPTSLIPSHYFIRLQPYINGNLTFDGYVEITMTARQATNKVILHINDIITKNDTIKFIEVSQGAYTSIPILRHDFDQERQFYIATLAKPVNIGEIYVLVMNFQGYLNNDMKGFYRSSYKDENDKTVMLATTQFQPTDARKAFPCFDEPAFRAKFTIEMVREEGYHTISNMPRYDSIPSSSHARWFVDRFNTTFPMSTYLVAFIVSDFGSVQLNDTENKYDYNFRVWSRKNAVSRLEYAIKLGPKISKFFEDFFQVPFPLPKQDMAAVPDFSAGAMENWGLIIYRESAFLYDEKLDKATDRMRVASVISHELAHQWFGDLVTPVWWTDLWLNEGFASYVEYLGLDKVEPSMKPMEQFVVTDMHRAFRLDSLESSHPISVPVENPDEINEIFDAISYSKGASILRMMSSFLTEDTFRRGLSKYLTELSYSNAEQDDLWRYLTTQAHTDDTLDPKVTVKDIMDTWTLQMGYPVITVQRMNGSGIASLKQERFLLTKSNSSSDIHDYKWWVPITFTTEESPDFNISQPMHWMNPDEASKSISGLPKTLDKWVIFNKAQTGFYRVNYDENNWKQIIRQLKSNHKVISNINKAQIIDDAMTLARSGNLNYTMALGVLSYIKQEKEYVPIKSALNSMTYIQNMFLYTGNYGYLKKFLSSLIIPLYEDVNFADHLSDPHLEQRKRAELLSWACELDYQPCVDAAVELYGKWMIDPDNSTIVSPNLKAIVYCTAIRQGGDKEWMFAWDRYMASNVGTERRELLEAMGCSKSVWILNEFLDRALSVNKGIKKQNVRYIIPSIAKTEVGRYVTWQFLRNRWNDLIDYFGSASFVLDSIVTSVTESLNTEVQLEEIKAFKKTYEGNFASATRAVDQAIERVMHNINWMKNYYADINSYLTRNNFTNAF